MGRKVLKKFASRSGFILCLLASSSAQSKSDEALIERGRYVIKTSGCNDCHTPGYLLNEGKTPDSSWLIGNSLGFLGPWGTTYAPNLRYRMQRMTEKEWVAYAKTLKVRPPMPWFQLNAMSDKDLKAIYHFVRSFGDSENKVPKALPPGEAPEPPYIDFSKMVPPAE